MPAPKPPLALILYRLYCWFIVLMQAGILAGAWALHANGPWLEEVSREGGSNVPGWFFPFAAKVLAGVAIGTGIIMAWAPSIKPSPKAYQVHLTNILAGMVLCLPFAPGLVVLLFWLRPETKAYFQSFSQPAPNGRQGL